MESLSYHKIIQYLLPVNDSVCTTSPMKVLHRNATSRCYLFPSLTRKLWQKALNKPIINAKTDSTITIA